MGVTGRLRFHLLCILVGTSLAWFGGCSRSNYRQRADREAVELIGEKSHDPRWQPVDFQVYPDERSRFYDPNDPDHPPMPPDDPESHKFMHAVGGMKHYKKWHKDGDTPFVENPAWIEMLPEYVPITEDGKVVLNMTSAAKLARIHSRDYQENLEEVYLAALDVAFERFRFDVQFFGGTDTLILASGNEPSAVLGRLSQPPDTEARTILDQRGDIMFSKRFATGAQLLASFANSMVFQFAGPDTNFSTSLLNFTLFQPLLRQGGKPFVLEQLTRVERNLLANIRAQAQFRQEFFKNVVVGGGTNVEPRRIGGFQGGAGLSGFTGTGAGGFGGVGAGFGGFGGGGIGGAGGAATGAGFAGGGEGLIEGFLGLVQQLQTIRNTQSSLAAQQLSLGILEANFEAGLIDLVQVDEFRQNIETERANLLRNQTALQDALEVYLVSTLGLPPTLPIELDDSAIHQFQFIDQNLARLQDRTRELLERIGALPQTPTVDQLRPLEKLLEEILAEQEEQLQIVQQERFDFEVRDKQVRLDGIETEAEKAQFENDLQRLSANLQALSGRIIGNRDALSQVRNLVAAGTEKQAADRMVELARKASTELQELSLIQARIRLEKISVRKVELEPDDAFIIARNNRLDWMNSRAALVDQWRLITFNANRLKSDLNIQIDGDIGTVGDNPFRFRGSTGTLQARLEFDAPLTRKSERNLYRESLIEYQRSKRSYVRFVDGIAFRLRSRLRQLDRLRLNLEIQRRALAIAIRRVDQTFEDLNRPTAPPQPGEQAVQLGPTIAQNLLRALSDLRNTQDNFMSVWLNYQQARMNLQFELGIIRFDEQGIWIDQSIEDALADSIMLCAETEHGSIQGYLDQLDGKVLEGNPKVAEELESLPEHSLPDNGFLPAEQPAAGDTNVEQTEAVVELTEVSEEMLESGDQFVDKTPGREDEKVRSSEEVRPVESARRLAKKTLGQLFPRESTAVRQVSEDEFTRNLLLVDQYGRQGLDAETIARKMSISVPEVRAYQRALERSQLVAVLMLAKEENRRNTR